MSRQVSNVDIIVDTFEVFMLKTNVLLDSLSTEVLTANGTYANTGNSTFDRTAQLYGTFGANTLVVSSELRGGNVNGLYEDLKISSNVSISNTAEANVNISVSNGSSISYLNPFGAVFGNTNQYSVSNTTIIGTYNKSANTEAYLKPDLISVGNTSASSNISSTNIKSGNFTVNSTAIHYGSNVSINLNEYKSIGVASVGNTSILPGSGLFGNSTNFVEYDKDGYRVTSNGSSSSYENKGFSYDGITSLLTESTNDIGDNSISREVFTFDKNNFTSGKIQAQIVNGSTTQISEILIAHNGTDVEITTYGSVASPSSSGSSSPLGTFSATLSGSDVNLELDQVISNSSVKIIAQMIV